MKTMTDTMAKAAGLLVVTDERKLPRPPLPDVVTPEWLEERLRQFGQSLQIDLATIVDTVIRHRLTQSSPRVPEQSPAPTDLLTTEEAAAYLRRSASWLLKRSDISYLRGQPNHYRVRDLDDWLARSRFKPRA